MLIKIAKKYSNTLIKRGIISEEEIEIQEYGFLAITVHILNYGAWYVLAALFNMIFETSIFILLYIPVRSVVGGWHASTTFRCGLCGIITWGITMLLIKNLILCPYYYLVVFLLLCILSVIIPSIKRDDITNKRKYCIIIVFGIEVLSLFVISFTRFFIIVLVCFLLAVFWNSLLFYFDKYCVFTL